jgi:uncharacterized protein (TIGR02757 family)
LGNNKKNVLANKLDYHYRFFDRSQISPDPLEFPRKFSDPLDIEISAFISAVFAYGNIKQIMKTLDRLHSIMDWHPYDFVMNYDSLKQKKEFKEIKHRFYSTDDIEKLFLGLSRIYKKENALKNIFLNQPGEYFDLKTAISGFSESMIKLICGRNEPTHGIKFMFPDPAKGSACKRMNLFLRWMVRKDELDFGLWNEIPTSQLIIPVDVHIARICKQLKLTSLNNVSWKMAEEITGNLKKFDSNDPVKYDFAICHIGMRKMIF